MPDLAPARSAMRSVLKRFALPLARPLLQGSDARVVVASTGRAGSTLLYDAVLDGYLRHKWGDVPRRLVPYLQILHGGFVARLESINAGSPIIVKTHDEIDISSAPSANYLFVYGDPLESAASVSRIVGKYGMEWFARHQYHLNAEGDFERLYREDVLNYEGQIRSWLGKRHPQVMGLSFDELWERQGEISGHVGFQVTLPERRPRTEKDYSTLRVNNELFDYLRRTTREHREALDTGRRPPRS